MRMKQARVKGARFRRQVMPEQAGGPSVGGAGLGPSFPVRPERTKRRRARRAGGFPAEADDRFQLPLIKNQEFLLLAQKALSVSVYP